MQKHDHKIKHFQYTKGTTPLVVLTAYTMPMAQIVSLHCDMVLVGDSCAMVLYGMDDTTGISLDMMIQHGKAVRRGAPESFIIVDMPFGTYEDTPEHALKSAQKIVAETKCDAVKLEGGAAMAKTVQYLVDHDIQVMGHIGLLPQSAPAEGGYKIKGKTDQQEKLLIQDAQALEHAGAFAIVIEGTIESVSQKITQALSIPTIGIGASAACDGQVLVTEDMLGVSIQKQAKFVKNYANLNKVIEAAASQYASEVRNGTFPGADHVYTK